MNQPAPTPQALHQMLRETGGELLRRQALQKMRGAGSTARTRPLWSSLIPSLVGGQRLAVELLPSLVLQVRDHSTGEVLIQTEPVEIGALVQPSPTTEEPGKKRAARTAATRKKPATPQAQPTPPADGQAPAEGAAA